MKLLVMRTPSNILAPIPISIAKARLGLYLFFFRLSPGETLGICTLSMESRRNRWGAHATYLLSPSKACVEAGGGSVMMRAILVRSKGEGWGSWMGRVQGVGDPGGVFSLLGSERERR